MHPSKYGYQPRLRLGWVKNHIPQDDILDYHPPRECNIYIWYKY